jgi:hypothetical protein
MPAHQSFVNQRIRRLRKQPTGLSKKTLSNIRCEITHLIRTVRGQSPRSCFRLSSGWLDIRQRLQGTHNWWALTRLAGFCSAREIDPQRVSDGDIERFVEDLAATGDVDKPVTFGRRVRKTWNTVSERFPELSLPILTIPEVHRPRWTLPEDAFPDSFRADVDTWFDRTRSDDPFAAKTLQPLRPSTIRTRRHQLFKAAAALVRSGRPVETIGSLADLVTSEAFEAALRVLYERQGCKKTEALHGLASGLLAVARHHVGVDPGTEDRLKEITANLDCRTRGFRNRTQQRLRAVEDPKVLSAMLGLPHQLLNDAIASRSVRKRRNLAQLAIATEILLFAPLRVANLKTLRIGHSMRALNDRARDQWMIEIAGEEVKNGTDLSYLIPPDSSRLIDRAIQLYEHPDGWLFPGRGAHPRCDLPGQIKAAVEHRVGIEWHTHMYRALAGYICLIENPDGYESLKSLLGNRDDQVVREHYAFLAERSLIATAQNAIAQSRAHFADSGLSIAAKPARRFNETAR